MQDENNLTEPKQKNYTAAGLALGIGIGVAIGSGVGAATGDMGTWTAVGIGVGVAIGLPVGAHLTKKHNSERH